MGVNKECGVLGKQVKDLSILTHTHYLWRMLRDLLKKIRDTKGRFHAKMGSIKDRNRMDLTEAEDSKKRCKKTQKNYAKRSSWPR